MFKLLDPSDCGESMFKKFVIVQTKIHGSVSATIFLTDWRKDEKGWKKKTDEEIFKYFDELFASSGKKNSAYDYIYRTLKDVYLKNDQDPWYKDRVECINLVKKEYEFDPKFRSLA